MTTKTARPPKKTTTTKRAGRIQKTTPQKRASASKKTCTAKRATLRQKTKAAKRATPLKKTTPPKRLSDLSHLRAMMRALVRGMYDEQKLRIQMGLRIVANFKVKRGQMPSTKEDTLNRESKAMLDTLRADNKRLTDALAKDKRHREPYSGCELIGSATEAGLVAAYLRIESMEKAAEKSIGKALREFPIYVEFLKGVCGVGPLMAGVIISEIDIFIARYPSSLWAYAGVDVAANGAGRSRKKEHLVEREYKAKDGTMKTRVGITFNPFLKTKLTGVLAASFLKAKSPYADIYYEHKTCLENHTKHKEKTKGHRHNMAMRYMIKRFLVDLYVAWKTLEGLPVSEEYSVAKLGRVHGG